MTEFIFITSLQAYLSFPSSFSKKKLNLIFNYYIVDQRITLDSRTSGGNWTRACSSRRCPPTPSSWRRWRPSTTNFSPPKTWSVRNWRPDYWGIMVLVNVLGQKHDKMFIVRNFHVATIMRKCSSIEMFVGRNLREILVNNHNSFIHHYSIYV